jgi:flavodoxin short chain
LTILKKISVIYWSGTGNTEKMADAIANGAKSEGTTVSLIPVGNATIEDVSSSDAVALGCPSMGAEVLEESEMEPFVASIENAISGKELVLFGSYGWGDGEWMRDWNNRMESYGANLLEEGLIINETPDDSGLEKCKALGSLLK